MGMSIQTYQPLPAQRGGFRVSSPVSQPLSVSTTHHQSHPIRFAGAQSTKRMGLFAYVLNELHFYGSIFLSAIICSYIKNPKLVNYWENKAIYLPTRSASIDALDSKALRQNIIDSYFKAGAGGPKLNGWYVPAPKNSKKPTVIIAHGNHGTMNRREDIMEAFMKRGYGVFAFDYRGFGKSEGKPSETGLYEDFKAASDFIAHHPSHPVPVNDQIPLGESLGGGVVVGSLHNMGKTRPPYKAVLLCSTFTSLPNVFAYMKKSLGIPAGWLPVEKRMQQHFASIDKIQGIQEPLLVVHGSKDADIPHEMSAALYQKATSQHKDHLLVKDGTHTGLFSLKPDQIIDHLEALLAKADGSKWDKADSQTLTS